MASASCPCSGSWWAVTLGMVSVFHSWPRPEGAEVVSACPAARGEAAMNWRAGKGGVSWLWVVLNVASMTEELNF